MSDQPPDDTGGAAPRKGRKDANLPFYEGEKIGDETPKYRRWGPAVLVVLGVAAVAALFIFLAGGEEDEPRAVTTTTTTVVTTTTITTTTVPLTTAPTTVPAALEPGDPCDPDDVDDCVDIDEDGFFTYLPGAEACLAETEDPFDCLDNDGDGDAGPPIADT